MKQLITSLKESSWTKILTVFLAGILLVLTTACSGANVQGANPQNPAVQAGGANNPYKNGGDKYGIYRESTDPQITNSPGRKQRDQASLQLNAQILIATKPQAELLYPGAETLAGRVKKEAKMPIITEKNFQEAKPGGLIQNSPDIGTRMQQRLEIVKETVEDASQFLKNKADEASARPELQKNPAVSK